MSDTAPRNPVSAPQMLADALLRSVAGTTALLRVTDNTDTSMSEVGLVATTFAEVRESRGVCANCGRVEGGRRIEVGAAGFGHGGGAAGECARPGVGPVALRDDSYGTVAGQDYLIESIAANEAFGQVYLYRLLLREARQQGL